MTARGDVAWTAHQAATEAADHSEPDPIGFELRCLWGALQKARDQAANGTWSVGCEHLVIRIAHLTMFYGRPIPATAVPRPLVSDRIYEAVHMAIGMHIEIPVTAAIHDKGDGRRL